MNRKEDLGFDIEVKGRPPILFIGGMERSGTSMIRAIIGSHPDIAVFQLDHSFWIRSFPNRSILWEKMSNQHLMKLLLTDLCSSPKYDNLLHKPEFDVVYGILRNENLNDIESYNAFTGIVFNAFMEEYRKLRDKQQWAFKSPGSEFFAEHILKTYPNAKFLHVYRNIMSVSSSRKKIGWVTSKSWGLIENCMKWGKSLELLHVNANKFRGRYLGINYDGFVADPETYIQLICAFLEINFHPQMLQMNDQPGWSGSNSSFEESAKTITSKFVKRKIENLSEEERNIINTTITIYTLSIKEKFPEFSISRMESSYLNQLGEDLYSVGKIDYAIMAFNKAIEIDPTNGMPLNNLGILFWNQNNRAMALKKLKKALEVDANRLVVTNLGQILKEVGEYGTANNLYSSYLSQFPEDEDIESLQKELALVHQ